MPILFAATKNCCCVQVPEGSTYLILEVMLISFCVCFLYFLFDNFYLSRKY